MQEVLLFLNGALLTAVGLTSWYAQRLLKAAEVRASSSSSDLQKLLKTIQETHNNLTEQQVLADKKLGEFGLTLIGIQERLRMADSLRQVRK